MKFSNYKVIKERSIEEALKGFFESTKPQKEKQAFILAEVTVHYSLLERLLKNKPAQETRQVYRKRPGIAYFFMDTGEYIVSTELDRMESAYEARKAVQ